MAKSSAKYFEVRWRTQGADEAWSAPQRIDPSKEVVVEGLDRTKSYDFEVRAVSNCGAMSIWVPSDYTVPTVPPLPAVNIPVGSGVADGVQLDWGDGTSTRADLQYEISRAPATGEYADVPPPPGHASWKRVAIVSGSTWVDAVTDTDRYWYRIRTVDYRGNVGEWAMLSEPRAAAISTPELSAVLHAALEDAANQIEDLDSRTDALRDDVDSTMAQMEILQGQVGDILQADEWVDTTAYPVGDLVQSNGKLYRAIQAVPAGTPVIDTAYWELIGNYASLGEAVSATAANVAVNNNKITQAQNDIQAQSQSIAENAAAIDTKASADALAVTDATVALHGDAITATASDVALLGAHDATRNAFNLNSATVKIDGGSTLAQTLSGLQASDNALGGRIDTEQSARVAGDAANATSITALHAASGDSDNLVMKGRFEDGNAGPWPSTEVKTSGSSGHDSFTKYGSINGSVYLPATFEYMIPVKEGDVLDITCDLSAYYMTAGYVRQALQMRNATNDTSVGTLHGGNKAAGSSGVWTTITATVVVPAGVAWIRPGVTYSGNGGTEYGGFTNYRVTRRSAAEKTNASAISAMDASVSNIDGRLTATASDVTALQATVGGQTASIAQLSQVTADTIALVPNAGFESFGSGNVPLEWQRSINVTSDPYPSVICVTTSPHTGSRCLRFSPDGDAARYVAMRSSIPVRAGDQYQLTFWTRVTQSPPAGKQIRSYIYYFDATGALVDYVRPTDIPLSNHGWTKRVAAPWTVPDGVAFVRLQFGVTGAVSPMYAYIDDIDFRRLGEAESNYNASSTLLLDVNGYVSGTRSENTGSTSSFSVVADNFNIVAPGGGDSLQWAGGVLAATKGSQSVKIGAGFGSDSDPLIFYYGSAGAYSSRTFAAASVAITAAGRYKFGSTWGGLISGWSSGGAISYTSTTTSATISVGSGAFRIGSQSISYNASSVSVSGTLGQTKTYYLYYDDPGMAGGSLTLHASTDPVTQYNSDGRVVIGQLAVTFKSGGGGGSNPVCPARNAYVWRRRGTEIRWVRAKRVRPGDWLRVIDPATGDLRWGLVTYSRSVPTECVTVATDAGVTLTCSRTAPLGTPDGEVLSIDAEGRTVSGYAGGFVTPKVTAVTATGRQWVQHITCENTFFLAGDKPGEGLAHHNLKPIRDL